jgi:hypothetical protein
MTGNIEHDGPSKWYTARMAPARREALAKLYAASQYAWIQLANPAMRAEYENRARTRKSAYALAVADFLNPPEIRAVSLEQYIGHAGDPITLHVTDDFKVAGVRVELLDIEGNAIERSEAHEQGNNMWRYTTKRTMPPLVPISLVITAFDIPGNTDKQTIHLVTGLDGNIGLR